MAHEQPPQRPPAPSLFIGPPAQKTTAASLQQEPIRQADPTYEAPKSSPQIVSDGSKTLAAVLEGRNAEARPSVKQDASGSTPIAAGNSTQMAHAPRTEDIWEEMQNTLEEVELGAAGGANAFGAEHARALEDLRKAQIALAQAWTRSEVDDEDWDRGNGVGDSADFAVKNGEHGKMSTGSVLNNRRRGNEAIDAQNGDKGQRSRAGTGGSAEAKSLEEETERDILLARKRRQANDRYFEKVNRGVVDVVERLESVAQKLKDVETEAQEIWDEDSADSDSP